MKLVIKNRHYDLLIVGTFIICFLFFLSNQILVGFIFGLLGLFIIRRQISQWSSENSIPLSISYAGFWLRLGSLSIDWGVYSIVFLILYLMSGKYIFDYFPYSLFAFSFLFLEIYMLKRWGQTIGKMAMGVKVVKTDFSELTWREVLLRCSFDLMNDSWCFLKACLVVSGIVTAGLLFSASSNPHVFPGNILRIFSDKLPTVCLLWITSEIIIILTNQKKRALHDFLAGTVVVVKKKANFWSPFLAGVLFVVAIASTWFFEFKNQVMTDFYAEKGDPQSQFYWGLRYYSGMFVDRNYDLAFQWFQKSAAQGNDRAQEHIGKMYEMGLGVKEDQAQAVYWYGLAAQNGNVSAEKTLKELSSPKHELFWGICFTSLYLVSTIMPKLLSGLKKRQPKVIHNRNGI